MYNDGLIKSVACQKVE